jgi:hypothetical protein
MTLARDMIFTELQFKKFTLLYEKGIDKYEKGID